MQLNKDYVSHETLTKLTQYAELLRKWSPKINLISSSTLDVIERRHIEDALQLLPLIKDKDSCIMDIGTGGGIPGIVLAAAGCENVTMVESDTRKAVFLSECIRQLELGTGVNIKAERVESLPPQNVDIMVSRACAPLSLLLEFACRHLKPDGYCLFLKGREIHNEIELATAYKFTYSLIESVISDGYVIKITNIRAK